MIEQSDLDPLVVHRSVPILNPRFYVSFSNDISNHFDQTIDDFQYNPQVDNVLSTTQLRNISKNGNVEELQDIFRMMTFSISSTNDTFIIRDDNYSVFWLENSSR